MQRPFAPTAKQAITQRRLLESLESPVAYIGHTLASAATAAWFKSPYHSLGLFGIMLLVHRLLAISPCMVILIGSATAVRELVIMDEPQPAQRLEGVVVDPSGALISYMTVTDRTEDGAA